MNPETKIMKEEFIKRTGIKPLKFRLLTGSMKEYVMVKIQGSEEDYNILNKSRIIGDIKITFIQFFKWENTIFLDIEKSQFKSNRLKIIKSL